MCHRVDQDVDRDRVGANRELVEENFRFSFAFPAIGDIGVVRRYGQQSDVLVEESHKMHRVDASDSARRVGSTQRLLMLI